VCPLCIAHSQAERAEYFFNKCPVLRNDPSLKPSKYAVAVKFQIKRKQFAPLADFLYLSRISRFREEYKKPPLKAVFYLLWYAAIV